MKTYLSPEEASLQLGISPREIRKYMRLGKIDLGIAIPPDGKGKHWRFCIYQGKIDRIMGKGGNPDISEGGADGKFTKGSERV